MGGRAASEPQRWLIRAACYSTLLCSTVLLLVTANYRVTVSTRRGSSSSSRGATIAPPPSPDESSVQPTLRRRASHARALPAWMRDTSHVRIPTHRDGTERNLEERVRLLELKLGGRSNWGVHDPFIGSTVTHKCSRVSDLGEFDGCKSGSAKWPDCQWAWSHKICLDGEWWKKSGGGGDTGKCVVYDFGIRSQPDFGKILSKPPFNCEVHAFDPSPVSKKWWSSTDRTAQELAKNPNYHFHPYGAGGTDGTITLNSYDWDQVSILRFPQYVDEVRDEATGKVTRRESKNPSDGQKSFSLKVKTLKTIMAELGHEHVDVLKLDVEGSEYLFLETMLDQGLGRAVDQITAEWHHHTFDSRYLGGSSPSINAIATLLHACGLELFDIKDTNGGWPSLTEDFFRLKLGPIRYQLASFMRVR